MTAATRREPATAERFFPPLVRVGPPDGSVPDGAGGWEPAPDLLPVAFSRGSGSAGLPSCTFAVDLAAARTLIVDAEVPTQWGRAVEVWLDRGPDPDDDRGRRVYEPAFFGELLRQDLSFGGEADEVVVTAALTPRMFGGPLAGPLVPDPLLPGPFAGVGASLLTGWPLEYNPRIDGISRPNRYFEEVRHPDGPDGEDLLLHPWQDPGTDSGGEPGDDDRGWYGPAAEEWDHRDAVVSLCRLLNPAEEYIENPDRTGEGEGDGRDRDPFTDLPALADVTVRPGAYLSAALDALLHPYGLDWTIDLEAAGDGEPSPPGEPPAMRRSVRVYRRGRGPEKKLRMQRPARPGRPAQPLSAAATTAANVRLSVDVGSPYTVVTVRGAADRTEAAVPLFRGWPEGGDGLTTAPPGSPAWREWVANEDGAYCGTRAGGPGEVPDEPPDWSDYGVTLPRRRRLGDRLTAGPDGRPLPPELFFRGDPPAPWSPVPPGWTWELLDDRVGVRFVGDAPPPELVALGDGAELLIVGTVVGDERIAATAGPSGRSPAAGERELVVESAHRFGRRRLDYGGTGLGTAGALRPGSFVPGDDADAIETFAGEVLRAEEAARVDAAAELVGLRGGYAVGDLLIEVAGRGVSLDRSTVADDRRRYAQVTAVAYDVPAAVTRLELRPSPGGPS